MGRSNVDDVQHPYLLLYIIYYNSHRRDGGSAASNEYISKRMRVAYIIMLFDHDDDVGFEGELFT